MWLSNVNCRGNESSLAMCQYTGLYNTGCTYLQDSSVVCTDGELGRKRGKEKEGELVRAGCVVCWDEKL